MKRMLPLLLLVTLVPGCATLQQVAALRLVTFQFDRVASVEMAGIPVGPGADYSRLGITNVARLAAAIADGKMPLDLVAHVAASNPPDNSVAARMVDLSWTLFVEDRKTVSGVLTDPLVIPPGTTANVPVSIQLDLMQFWDGSARDLFDLAIDIAGGRPSSRELRLELLPTIETSLGPIAYPTPIVVTRRAGS
jgi:hypothetical protein